MSASFDAVCDDFYVACRLFLKLEIRLDRESVLGFFDRVRKELPNLNKLRRREDGSLVLEEEDRAEGLPRQWLRVGPTSLRFGHFAPPDTSSVRKMADVILQNAPYFLTLSDLDFDHLEVVYGFDLDYKGNHDQMVAETFYADHPLSAFLFGDEAHHVIEAQPFAGIALSPSCDLQANVEIKSRTTSFEVRTGEYDKQPVSVYLTCRRYWGFSKVASVLEAHNELMDLADDLAANRVVPTVVSPLAAAIASRS